MSLLSRVSLLAVLCCAAAWGALLPSHARAYINQADGVVVPLTTRLQQCLDRPGTGETMVGALDAIADASVLPEAYRPVLDTTSGA